MLVGLAEPKSSTGEMSCSVISINEFILWWVFRVLIQADINCFFPRAFVLLQAPKFEFVIFHNGNWEGDLKLNRLHPLNSDGFIGHSILNLTWTLCVNLEFIY